MATYERILVATDFSEQAAKAIVEAVRIARREGAELHVLHVDVIALQNLEGFDYPPLADYVRSLDQTSLAAVGRGIDVNYRRAVTAIVRDTSPAAGILRYAAAKQIDLIVVGTHGRSAAAELFLGSVAQEVVSKSPVPVVVAGSKRAARPPAGGKPCILAAVDFSPGSKTALIHAGRLATASGAHLIVLHVVDLARIPHGGSRAAQQEEERARDELDAFVSDPALPIAAETLLGKGHAGEEIVDIAARRDASLLVIAPSSHRALDRLLLGSVCKAVIRGAPCPVLIHRDTAAAKELPAEAPRSEAA